MISQILFFYSEILFYFYFDFYNNTAASANEFSTKVLF